MWLAHLGSSQAHVAIREFELSGVPAKVTAGCTITSTLVHYGDYTVEKCVDGDIGSWFWAWPAKVGDHVLIKLAAPITKSSVSVLSGHPDGSRDHIVQAQISASVDGTTFVPCGLVAKRGTVSLPAAPIRALRLDFVQVDPSHWVAIREIVFQ